MLGAAGVRAERRAVRRERVAHVGRGQHGTADDDRQARWWEERRAAAEGFEASVHRIKEQVLPRLLERVDPEAAATLSLGVVACGSDTEEAKGGESVTIKHKLGETTVTGTPTRVVAKRKLSQNKPDEVVDTITAELAKPTSTVTKPAASADSGHGAAATSLARHQPLLWPMTLTPIMVLFLNFFITIFPVIAILLDPAPEGIMSLPPRDPKKTIANGGAVTLWFLYGGAIFLTSLLPLLIWPEQASSTEPNVPVTMLWTEAGPDAQDPQVVTASSCGTVHIWSR